MERIGNPTYTGVDGSLYYYQKGSKRLYRIEKAKQTQFTAFRHLLILAVAVGALLYSFLPSWQLAFVASLAFYGLTTYHFYKKILPPNLHRSHVELQQIESLIQPKGAHGGWQTIATSLAGLVLIIASFLIETTSLNRAILIAFGILVVVGNVQQLNRK